MTRAGLPRAVRRLFRLDALATGVEREVDDELQFHFDMAVREFTANGMSEHDARRAAEQRFGDVTAARERLAAIDRQRLGHERRAARLSALAQDVRYALRGMRRAPGFAAVVVLTLALGIGANATMFGIVDHLLLSLPPGVSPGTELTRVYFERRESGLGGRITPQTNYAVYERLRDSNRTFDHLAAAWISRGSIAERGDEAHTVKTVMASGNYFAVIGTRPQRGRLLLPADDSVHRPQPVAVISDAYWRSRYGADETVIGKAIVIDERPFTIIGVAPAGFGGLSAEPLDVWIPLSVAAPSIAGSDWYITRSMSWLATFGRLHDGVSREAASADLARVMHGFTSDTLDMDHAARVIVAPVQIAREPGSTSNTTSGSVALWLGGVSVAVLLIACANVANLQLARALRRRREFAVRVALGIGRARLIRQLMTESLLFAVAGGAAALLVAHWGGAIVRRLLLPGFLWSASPVDARVLVFTAVTTIVAGFVTGFAPIIQLRLAQVAELLRAGAREGTTGRSALRTSLLVTQAALSVVLLVGAGVFLRSLHRIRTMDYGFEPSRVFLVDATFVTGTTMDVRIAAYERMAERARTLPGVTHAALSHTAPFWSMLRGTVRVPDADTLPPSPPLVNSVSPDYFGSMGTPLVAGRPFTEGDRFGAPRVAIVNASFAKWAWRGGTAIGRCIKVGGDTMPCSEVVGVVPDAKVNTLDEAPVLQFYVPIEQRQRVAGMRTLSVRMQSSGASIAALRRALLDAAPQARFIAIDPLQSRIEPQARPWRLGAMMFGLFGALALLLTSVGLYSVINYVVTQRMHEFGVRAALGAHTKDLIALVVARGLIPAVIGLAIGLALALVLGRFVQPLLFDTSPNDSGVISSVVAVLLGVAVAACIVPALRAARVDPASALRAE
jgi:putative ABC transport system permease protein